MVISLLFVNQNIRKTHSNLLHVLGDWIVVDEVDRLFAVEGGRFLEECLFEVFLVA